MCSAALAQPGPRPLPPPDVPLAPLPSARPYQGPPAIIDGPSSTFGGPPPGIEIRPEGIHPEVIPPGTGTQEYLPLPGSPLSEPITEGELYYVPPQKLSSYKNGFFQKLSLSAAWFGNSNDPEDLGGTEIETFLTVALPAPIKEWPLLISPGYNMTNIDGPTVTDLPPRLYLAYVDFMWLPTVVHRWTALLSVAPSVFGDFEANEFRITGKGLVIYDWVPRRLQFVAGVLYLNRDNATLLPAGGLIWSPADWTRFEILFPKPKFALRFNVGDGFEDWIFTTAEFGGNTWPIVRTSGAEDDVTYVDYRIMLGVERKLNGGAGYRLEGGYVFGRTVEYTSHNGDFDPQDTFILRGAIVF